MKKVLQKHLKSKKIITSIGEITLVNKIGEGGNGIVYSATFQGEEIAIKFLTSDVSGKALKSKRDRFLSEYFNVVKLEDKKGVVKYLNYDVLKLYDDNKQEISIPMILMEKYDKSLKSYGASTAIYEFVKIFNFLLDTIERIHKQGIIHRDLKPENILIKNKEYVIADFGIASYNPDIFELRAKTKSSERLGNRLFSAPEQENGGVEARQSMDIYSIGQILQWLATGETHRGTGRKKITSIYNISEEVTLYDHIIEKCLFNNPSDRFQSIEEIREYMMSSIKRDYYDYFLLFHNIIIKNFPKNNDGIVYSEDRKRIGKLFNDIKEKLDQFDKMLWFTNGSQASEINLTLKKDNILKLDNYQLDIDKVWINYDNSLFNDFILIHYKSGVPFLVNGKEQYHSIKVDETHEITYSEYEAGYAEINNESVDLSNHDVEMIEVPKHEGYLFICTKFHCAFIEKNQKVILGFLENALFLKKNIEHKELIELRKNIRKNKHSSVMMNL